MPSIRVRQAGTGDHTATLTDEGLSAVQTLEKRQYRYLLAAYVQRQYHPAGKDLPAATRSSLRQIAGRARYDPQQRSSTGLPRWERGMVLVAPTDWRGVIGGIVVHCAKGRGPDAYVPLFMDQRPVEGRLLYLLVPPDG